jgi:protein-disulfide isomerase
MSASLATYCAGQQAPKLFWELHDWIFENQAKWSEATDAADQFKKQALALGVKEADYGKCVADPASTARIQKDQQDAIAMGVQGTPAFFVNDWFISGAAGIDEFKDKIEKAKAGQKPPPTPTPLPEGVEFWQPDPQRPGRNYDGSFYLGDAKAPVAVLAFEDFKSAESAEHLKSVEPKLKSDYIDKGQARYVVQLFAVTAPRAAAAALCAGQQNKFWEFRELLYTKQAEWAEGDDAAMQGFAKSLGLDEKAFGECLAGETVHNQVQQALSLAQEDVGVPSAPSYLMLKINAQGKADNGKGYPGALALDQFEQAIKDISAPPTPAPTPPPSISKADLASLPVGRDADGNFYRGDPKAAVKLVDYSDFQCPYCARHVAETEPSLYDQYMKAGKVLHVYRNFPLDFHANAPGAAKAAICAGEQDPKLFWEMHDWLFANQATWGSAQDAADQFRKQALAIGADSGKYDACISDVKTQAIIDKDLKDGAALGVSGTPAFFLYKMKDGQPAGDPTPLSGALPYDRFSQVIDGLLAP